MEVVRTYLEMTSPADLVPAATPDHLPRLEALSFCPPSFYRYLYLEVGRAYHWRDRAGWTDEQIRVHLARPGLMLWLMSVGGAPAGFFELLPDDRGRSVEIAYFGLLPEAIGRGLGGHLLNEAVRAAWSLGPERVWLHTCTLDHAAALPNYLARGFRYVKEERYEVEE
jgi:GNAT superfamily N-acetyltransferase